ncbi:MAG: hypothetical protein ACOVK6_05305, partial [Ramlibacter sp.]
MHRLLPFAAHALRPRRLRNLITAAAAAGLLALAPLTPARASGGAPVAAPGSTGIDASGDYHK